MNKLKGGSVKRSSHTAAKDIFNYYRKQIVVIKWNEKKNHYKTTTLQPNAHPAHLFIRLTILESNDKAGYKMNKSTSTQPMRVKRSVCVFFDGRYTWSRIISNDSLMIFACAQTCEYIKHQPKRYTLQHNDDNNDFHVIKSYMNTHQGSPQYISLWFMMVTESTPKQSILWIQIKIYTSRYTY